MEPLRGGEGAPVATERDALVQAARDARSRAHAPYSGYSVGAALRTADGAVITGANVENASFGLTVCAERIALFRWCTESTPDQRSTPLEMAIAAGPTGQDPSGGRPCGACLQVMQEFAPDLRIWIVDEKAVAERRLSDLLPDPFVPGGQLPGGADGNDAGGHEE